MISISERTIDCDQGSHEWFQARLGCVTSSRVGDCCAKLKRKEGEAACRRDMRMELACELLTGNASEHYVSRWMKEGKEKEPLARAEYEIRFNVTVEQVGFVYHPSISKAGASPDGLVGSDGMIEIKCPKIETHIQYLIDGVIPGEYIPQMVWQLGCCDGRKWSDFVSYCPELPDQYQLFVKRLHRTAEVDALIRGMQLEVVQFLSEVDEMLAKLKQARKEALAGVEA